MNRAALDKDTYRIRVTDVKGSDLRGVDGTGPQATSDPYVVFDFASYKFKTPVLKKDLNPKWVYEHSFTFAASLNDVLSEMSLSVQCWDHNMVFRDVLLGYARSDLATVFTGPMKQEYKLHHDGFPENGTISFNIEVQLIRPVVFRLTRVKITWDKPEVDDYSIKVCHSRLGDLGKYGPKITSDSPEWTVIGEFMTEQPLALINTTHICYLIYKEKGDSSSDQATKELVGKTQVNIGKYFSYGVSSVIAFQEPIVNRRAKIGTLEGTIVLENIGLIAQMPGGVNTESGVVGGVPFHRNLPVPASFRKEVCNESLLGLKATNLGLTLTTTGIAQGPQRNLMLTSINPDETGYGLLGDQSDLEGPPLPPGWGRFFDPRTREYYHENETTKERRKYPPT